MNIIPSNCENIFEYNRATLQYYGNTNYSSYEEALEEGLYQALLLIKKK